MMRIFIPKSTILFSIITATIPAEASNVGILSRVILQSSRTSLYSDVRNFLRFQGMFSRKNNIQNHLRIPPCLCPRLGFIQSLIKIASMDSSIEATMQLTTWMETSAT